MRWVGTTFCARVDALPLIFEMEDGVILRGVDVLEAGGDTLEGSGGANRFRDLKRLIFPRRIALQERGCSRLSAKHNMHALR